MPRVPLLGAAYASRSLIAAAQRCVNLYTESVPQNEGEPVQKVHLLTPGLKVFFDGTGPVRGLYLANNGVLFGVIDNVLATFDELGNVRAIGAIPGTGLVSMDDNGTTLVVVTGAANAGWTVNLASLAFAPIVSAGFYGATRVRYVDTYFAFNKPGTQGWYLSDAEAVTFDDLYFANKVEVADNLRIVEAAKGEIWLIGDISAEIFFNSGAADFPYQRIPSATKEQGTAAANSVARAGETLFWLSQNRTGERFVVMTQGYDLKRVSNYGVEEALRKMDVVSDAIGMTYQQGGHTFYVLTFPTADQTWCLDVTEGDWHERVSLDSDGVEHRCRFQCTVRAFGKILAGDYANGIIYELDPETGDENGTEIKRVRSFMHMVQDGDRVSYRQFIADMEVGNSALDDEMQVSLRWSDDRGKTFGNPVVMSNGARGDYLMSMQVQRLGMARDRVFELSWAGDAYTSLTGAFIEATKLGS